MALRISIPTARRLSAPPSPKWKSIPKPARCASFTWPPPWIPAPPSTPCRPKARWKARWRKAWAMRLPSSLGGNFTEASFNEDTRRDWHLWLEAKYETVQRLNELMGLRHWGQVVTAWNQVPMPMSAPSIHNPALVLDWCRFCSDTIVQFVKMQADLLHQLTPKCPVTTNLRPLIHRFDHFDVAEAIDFVSIESTAALKAKSAELACEID